MILRILSAEVCGPYQLNLKFNNGVEKRVNLYSLLEGEIFELLKDPKYFEKVELDPVAGTVVWPNQADFAPEALYELEDLNNIPSGKLDYTDIVKKNISPSVVGEASAEYGKKKKRSKKSRLFKD